MSKDRPSAANPTRPRLFWKIFVVLLVCVAFAGASVFTLSIAWTRSFSTTWVDEVTNALDEQEAALLELSSHPAALDEAVRKIGSQAGASLRIWSPKEVRAQVERGELPRRDLNRVRRGRTVVRNDEPARGTIAYWPLIEPGSRDLVAVVEISPPRPRRGWLPLALILVSGSIAAGAWMLARNLAQRLERLSQATQRIAAGELDAPVGSSGAAQRRRWLDDEIDDVADDFERMREQISVLVEGQRRLLANVSHELRTPIARMRVTLDLADERLHDPRYASEQALTPVPIHPRAAIPADTLPSASADALDRSEAAPPGSADLRRSIADLRLDLRELSALVDDLLTAGRLELGDRIRKEPTDLVALLDAAADRFAAELESDGPCELNVDPLLIDRIIRNLLSNARRATPDGDITLRCVAHGGDDIVVVVRDDGDGIPSELRELIFAPFSRLDAARDRDRGGAGLGLFLCRQIAQAHGGSLVARARTDGQRGAEFVLVLPGTCRMNPPLQPSNQTR